MKIDIQSLLHLYISILAYTAGEVYFTRRYHEMCFWNIQGDFICFRLQRFYQTLSMFLLIESGLYRLWINNLNNCYPHMIQEKDVNKLAPGHSYIQETIEDLNNWLRGLNLM